MPAPSIHQPDRQVDDYQHKDCEDHGCIRRIGETDEDVGMKRPSYKVHPWHVRHQPRYQIRRDRVRSKDLERSEIAARRAVLKEPDRGDEPCRRNPRHEDGE